MGDIKASLICYRCKSNYVERASDGRIRCAKCRRLIALDPQQRPDPDPETEKPPDSRSQSPYRPIDPAEPITGLFYFVSKKLDLLALPRHDGYSQPTIVFGDEPYFRLTPRVLAWVFSAIADGLEPRLDSGTVPRSQVEAAVEVYSQLAHYADRVFVPEAVRSAFARPPELPPVPPVL